MKKLFKGLLMSISMFSIIPVFKNIWDDDSMNLVIPCLPVVGMFIGIINYFISLFIKSLSMPIFITSSLIMFIPFILSGFLHIDGYMDTSDAILSRRGLEEKRRILKDPLVGSFAVIALAILFMLQFSSIHTLILEDKPLEGFIFIPVLARGLSSMFLLNLKSMSKSGYGATFKKDTNLNHNLVLVFFILFSISASFFLSGIKGIIISFAVLVSSSVTAMYTFKELDGISGDLCGCIITLSELFGFLAMAIV